MSPTGHLEQKRHFKYIRKGIRDAKVTPQRREHNLKFEVIVSTLNTTEKDSLFFLKKNYTKRGYQ